MYPQPTHPQQTWSTAQFAQGPMRPTLSAWPTAPVISTMQHPAAAAAVSHAGPPPAFVPPPPPGVNPQQWQNGRWMYTAPPGGVSNVQPHGPYPPPSIVGWNIPDGWGITPQYYYPAPVQQKQPDKSYWETRIGNNGLGLENMHIKQQGAQGEKAPRTPWAWVPRELDDDDSPTEQPDSALQYHSAQQSLQPSPVEPGGRPNGATASASAAVSGTGFPGSGSGHHAPPSHPYFSVPGGPQQQQHQQSSTTETGSSSRPVLPPPAVYSAHVRQQSNNPPQTTTATHHHQPSAAPAPHSATSLPSQPTHNPQAMQRSHTLAAPTPQRPGLPESFTSVKQLRPTFSPNIVRTPNHYRQDSHGVVPSPRITTWDEANSNSAGASTSANKHLSGAMQSAGLVPSPRVLPWNAHTAVNDGGSPTPAPRHPRPSRTDPSRIYGSSARPSQPVQRSYSIPEPPRRLAVSRQNSMPVVPGGPDPHHHHHHHLTEPSIADLPQFAEEPGAITSLSPLLGTGSSVSSESSTSTIVVSESPPPLFVPPRYGRSPSPSPQRRRSRSSSPSSSSGSDSDSEDSDSGGHYRRRGYRSPIEAPGRHRTYSGQSGHHHHHPHYQPTNNNTNRYSGSSGGGYPGPGAHTPQGRSPASSTRTYHSSSSSNPLPTPPQERRDPGFSLPPLQQPKPPRGTYSRQVRYGFWNRRGDYLTMDKYVVYAPHGRTNPPELEAYPAPTEGYMDHYGNFAKYDPTLKELPESLPRQGQPPLLPYDKFVTYVYL